MSAIVLLMALLVGGSGAGAAERLRLSAEASHPLIEEGGKRIAYLKVGLSGFELRGEESRAPVNVAIVIDKSGSMSGDKIAQARRAAREAVRSLRRDDIVSVVAYSDRAEVLVPATRAAELEYILERIDRLEADGSTALHAGVSRGAEEARKFIGKNRVNRIVLLSDGQANVGPSSTPELVSLGRKLAREGLSITTLGLGGGYNEDLMTALAEAGDGNHAFIESADDLAAIFRKEFGLGLAVAAREAEITITCENGVRPVRLLGREGEIDGRKATVKVGQIYAGQERYALLEIEVDTREAADGKLASAQAEYRNLLTGEKENLAATITARFTHDAALVEKNLNKSVMVAVVRQLANERSREAVRLYDCGRIEEARARLRENVDFLKGNASSLDAPILGTMAGKNAADATALGAPADAPAQRKDMLSRQLNEAQQNAY